MDDLDKRELANFLDTEGYIGIIRCINHKRNGVITFIPEITIANTERNWLERIEAKWGGKIYPVNKSSPNDEQGWHLKLHGEKLIAILEMVRPYLQTKGEQCDLTRELQRRITHGIGKDIHRRLTDSEKAYRADLHKKCRLLNAKGPRGSQIAMPEPKTQTQLRLEIP